MNTPICPACTSRETETLHTISATEAANIHAPHFVDERKHLALSTKISSLWQRDQAEIKICQVCGFGFSWPFVSGDSEYYSLAFPRSGDSYPQQRWEFKETCRHHLKKSGLNTPRVLEIGAGDGGFARCLLQDVGRPTKYLAVEYSDYGRRKLEEIGVEVIGEDIRLRSRKENLGKFDIICLFQVLEHLDDIDSLIKVFKSMLSDEGYIYVSTPNREWVDFHENNGGTIDYPPNHIGRWGVGAYQALAERHGLIIEEQKIQNVSKMQRIWNLAKYRFYRSRSINGTLAAKVEMLKAGKFKKILRGMIALLEILMSPRGAFVIAKSIKYSPNIWVCFGASKK